VLGLAAVPAAAQVECEVREENRVYEVKARFTAPVSPSVAWEVLTDYDRIAFFVNAIRSSRSYRSADSLIVHQHATVGVFPFRRSMQVDLLIQETPGSRVAFEDILGNDFKFYRGSWQLDARGGQVEVSYRLESFPYAVPFSAVGRRVIAGSVRDLLEQVRSEMLRREAAAGGWSAPRDSSASKEP